MQTGFQIREYVATDRKAVLALALDAWEPVFAGMEASYDPRVWAAFFPNGWCTQHEADVASALDDPATHVFIADVSGEIVGFSGLREHAGDSMGEIYIIGVTPARQGEGLGAVLTAHALDWMRASYEASGFRRLDVARYFKPID